MLNFELLIKEVDGLTLFEQSVFNLLNLEIRTLPDSPEMVRQSRESNFFYNFKGYKVSNSHFSLGSKIHIQDYYYAKRMFYHSFYANRFAFLVAKYLLDNSIFTSVAESDKKITLIGYSRYSELLVSNVRRLLEDYLKAINSSITINHDVILEDGRALKNPAVIQKNVVVIIPIASTFSTSAKIKKAIDNIRVNLGNSKITIVNNEIINVLCVVDEKTFNNEQFQTPELEKIYKPFGWKTRNSEKRIVTLENEQKQKYFINLDSKWFLTHECESCFPHQYKYEKCLLETGVNAVSPESIFSFPITGNSIDCDRNIDYNQYFKYNVSSSEQNQSFILKNYLFGISY